MATFVLVHGATAGGWYMQKVARLLQAAGHTVFTPTLTGLGERVHLATPDIDLNTHILDIVNVLKYEDLHDVILVGKSYSGMVITGVAERVPERIRHLVYLDAVVPQDGQSLADLYDQETVTRVKEAVRLYGDGWRFPGDSSIDARVTDHPFETFLQPVEVKNPAAAAIPRTFIYCTKAPAGITEPVAKSAARARAEGWCYRELPSNHEPEQMMPQALADVLLELV